MTSKWTIVAVSVGLCVLLAGLGVVPAGADDYTLWRRDPATPGDWFDPGNWTDGVPDPHHGFGARIDNGGEAQIDGGIASATMLYLGTSRSQSGTVRLGGTGQFSANWENIGVEGTGRFVQTGGTHAVGAMLLLGAWHADANGTYELSGTGELTAPLEYHGYGGWGRFEQTGGSHSTGYMTVNPRSQYLLTGGTLQVNRGLNLEGTLDFGGSGVTLQADNDVLVNLSQGTVLGSSQASLEVGSNSLTVVPTGFDPHSVFATFSTAGMVHTSGEELVVPAGEGFSGVGVIRDHVRCQGTVRAPDGGGLELRGGATVGDGGYVNLGEEFGIAFGGRLLVADDVSGISGGQLRTALEFIGCDLGAGRFVQTGGLNMVGSGLNVGYAENDGTYELHGGELSSAGVGTGAEMRTNGRFIQTDGLHTTGYLDIGFGSDSNGVYELSGGRLVTSYVSIGEDAANGQFIQTGGALTVSDSLVVAWGLCKSASGSSSGSQAAGRSRSPKHGTGPSGTYDLSGGCLFAGSEEIGGDEFGSGGHFLQTGGTNCVGGDLVLGIGSEGIYELRDGQLVANYEWIGRWATGRFIQTGGTNNCASLRIRNEYTVSGGRLTANDLSIAGYSCSPGEDHHHEWDSGTLNLADPATPVVVSETLTVHEHGTLAVTPGATIQTGDVQLEDGGTFCVQPTASLATWGEHTWTPISAGHGIHGTFTNQPTEGDHVGSGVFQQGLTYSANAVDVTVFQAAPGDTDGDREVNGDDIQAILAAGLFATGLPADWPQGDFNGDGICNGDDIQAMLAANVFNQGPYAGDLPAGAGDGVVDLIVTPQGLLLDTHGATINGYVLQSDDGVFTAGPANNLGLFQEDADRRIGGQMGFRFTGTHVLGDVVGDEFRDVDLFDDLSLRYTIAGSGGLYYGTLIIDPVPEPSTLAVLGCGVLGLLLWRRRKRAA